jgi:hypothetical protein
MPATEWEKNTMRSYILSTDFEAVPWEISILRSVVPGNPRTFARDFCLGNTNPQKKKDKNFETI